MANKYIIHGATYCGDGTASNEATSNGGVGAWNNIGIFQGNAPSTYGGTGVVAGGDTVYIRSKTGNGADGALTVTLGASATLGSSAATTSAWVTWVIDGGTIWAGIDGTVTYECPSTYYINTRDYNEYRAQNASKLVIKEANASGDKYVLNCAVVCKFENLFVDLSVATSVNGSYISAQGNNSYITITNMRVKAAAHYYGLFRLGAYSKYVFFNLEVECIQAESRSGIFESQDYGTEVICYGGRIYGTGATDVSSMVKLYNNRSGLNRFAGMVIPRAMKMVHTHVAGGYWRVEGTGLDNGGGAFLQEGWGEATSRSDGYFPTLDAMYPDSVSTPWSWKIYPSYAAVASPFALSVSKMYTGSAGVKTITANVLLADSITTANAGSMWIEIDYVDDSTGERRHATSRDYSGAALSSSTAGWSATTYGAVNLLKRALSITTPTSVKQDTQINITLCGIWKAATSLDIMFFDPDVSIS